MKTINLLEYLNSVRELHALDYTKCEPELVNFLDLMIEDEQFTRKIDLGIMFVSSITTDNFIVIDGLNRLLSLSLLLHALCECYKKTSEKNDKAIKTIRSKYLLNDYGKTKLRLPEKEQDIYNKIIFGERLSGHEKESSLFVLLHNFWAQIKEEKLQASSILTMLNKICVMLVETDEVPNRDLYYSLNKNNRNLNQLLLVEDYLRSIGIVEEWDIFKKIFQYKTADMNSFFKDFFVTKFNFKEFNPDRLYETFVNYFETMLQYMSEDIIIAKFKRSAALYLDILNVNLKDEDLKRALIKIKMHNGEDTYAYLLSIYEDYVDERISGVTFLEILNTIDEYLINRQKSPSNVMFNELIQYLNVFITCK